MENKTASSKVTIPRTDYFGAKEVYNPGHYFLTPGDYAYIRDGRQGLSRGGDTSKGINMEFSEMLRKRQFKATEKSLLENINHPYYLLNLVLFYIYFDKAEFLEYFRYWQGIASPEQKIRFVDVLAGRSLFAAMAGLKDHWLDREVLFYAQYQWFKSSGQTDKIVRLMSEWKDFLNPGRSDLFEAVSNELTRSPAKQEGILTRDNLTREFLTLKNTGYYPEKFEKMRKLTREIDFLTEIEKAEILAKINAWENESQKNHKEEKLKVRIKPAP